VVPKTLLTDFKDILDRFYECSGQISRIFWVDFRDVLAIISSTLTIMDIHGWTIQSFFPSIILYCTESRSVLQVITQIMGFV